MLTKADDFPIHQTPEPIAFSGTDRNFYDRYFFNGILPDGGGFFAVAFGVYPHLNIMDAHFAVIRDGVEYCLHASRHLNMERMDMSVGPIRIEIIEPLQMLKIVVEEESGLSAEIIFKGFGFPIKEPRFVHRFGPRAFMDYTRLTQSGSYQGWISIDGVRHALPDGTEGVRDRSWGIRSIGETDPQPFAPPLEPGFFWTWAPCKIADTSYYFHICADGPGNIWNVRAASTVDGGDAYAPVETEFCEIVHQFEPGTRYPSKAVVNAQFGRRAPELTLEYTPVTRFLMRGVGYFHPEWQHGKNQGPYRVQREDIILDQVDPLDPQNVHIQAISQVILRRDGALIGTGWGILESLVQGPYAPYGFQGTHDGFAG